MTRLKFVFVIFGLLLANPVFALLPNDPLVSEQGFWNHISAPAAWDQVTGSNQVVVAVLDTGMDLDHPDLLANLWVNSGEIAGDGFDNDGNGYVDDVNGWDFVDDDNKSEPDLAANYNDQAVSHGTVIAGVIGAVGNNGEGVTGLNWQVKIMPLRILDNQGSGSSHHARAAVKYAIDNDADIINLSFTGFEKDPLFESYIQEAYEKGIFVVAAVGNDPENGGLNLDERPIYPACFTGGLGQDWVMGVAATTLNDQKAPFSNYGSVCTDISAPGVDIFSTDFYDPEIEIFDFQYSGGWSGTSIASPFVSGAAALLKAKYPELTPAQLKTILQLSVDPVYERGTPAQGKIGAGRINIAKALEIAVYFAEPTSTDEPVLTEPIPSAPIQTDGKYIVVAPAKGEPPLVRVFNYQGQLITSFMAYAEGFTGGVRLALGDIDADGQPEIVTVPGPGGGPHVRMFEMDGSFAGDFFALEMTDRTGLYVAVGDVDRDMVAEILIGVDEGRVGNAMLFEPDGRLISAYSPFGETKAAVRVAIGDLDGDGDGDLIFSRGLGYAPEVMTFTKEVSNIRSFMAYAETYDRGVYVSAGDIDRDGIDEIVTGTDQGGGPQVRVFEADGSVRSQFFAYDEMFRGGVRVGTAANGEIVTAAGPGGGPHVRLFDAFSGLSGGFFSDQEAGRNGINVAIW